MLNTLLSFSGYDGAKKILSIYFDIEVSQEFLSCLDLKATKEFEASIGINVKPPIRMGWRQEDGFLYQRGIVSKMNANIYLKYGIVTVQILWQSKSGRIYEPADADIDCNDIQFWFEYLDAELCKNYLNPKWSLFNTESFKFDKVNEFKSLGIEASYEFLRCADVQLTALLIKQTALKFNGQVCFIIPSDRKVSVFQAGNISKLQLELSVYAYANPVTIQWQSKSGRIYLMNDTDVDCNDIEFSFESLETEKYIAQFYPKGQKLPFVLKNLPYELEVVRLNVDCTIFITVKQGFENNRETIITALQDFTTKFNDASEKKSNDGEIVKNYLGRTEGDNMIAFEVDMSIAGFDYFKKLLKFIAKTAGITKVQIE